MATQAATLHTHVETEDENLDVATRRTEFVRLVFDTDPRGFRITLAISVYLVSIVLLGLMSIATGTLLGPLLLAPLTTMGISMALGHQRRTHASQRLLKALSAATGR